MPVWKLSRASMTLMRAEVSSALHPIPSSARNTSNGSTEDEEDEDWASFVSLEEVDADDDWVKKVDGDFGSNAPVTFALSSNEVISFFAYDG